MILKLAKIFLKLSELTALDEYLHMITPGDKSITNWMKKELNNNSIDDVETAIKYYLDNKDNLKRLDSYTLDDLLTMHYEGFLRDDNDIGGNVLNKALEITGAKLISSGEGEPILGRGFYGTVYDVAYKGKRCAMKVSDAEDDSEGYLAVQHLYNKMPDFLKKHFPIIYSVETFKDDEGFDCSVVIMEHLYKLPPGLKLQGWGFSKEEPARTYETVKDPEFNNIIHSMYLLIKNDLYDAIVHNIEDVLDPTEFNAHEIKNLDSFVKLTDKENFTNFCLKSPVNSYGMPTLSDFTDIVRKYLQRELMYVIRDLIIVNTEEKNHPGLLNKAMKIIKSEFINKIINSLNIDERFRMPMSNMDVKSLRKKHEKIDIESKLKDKRLIEFYKAMQILDLNNLINFSDVHGDNVMYRPDTDSIVFADVGLFSMP